MRRTVRAYGSADEVMAMRSGHLNKTATSAGEGICSLTALPWQLTEPPIMSEKDARAPDVATAEKLGLLATYEECLAFYERNRACV